jgi:plastocyanin
MTRTTRLITVLTALITTACGGSSGGYGGIASPPPPTPDPRTITASPSLAFAPATLTVSVGDTVTFAFQSVAHNVFFDAQAGTPANIEGSITNSSITRVFTTAGTYHYTCHIHPFMEGTVVVVE